MNIKSKSYMANSEFKERQNRFELFCAQAFEFMQQFHADCIAGWKKLFRAAAPKFKNMTLALHFEQLTHRKWQQRAKQACFLLNAGYEIDSAYFERNRHEHSYI